MAEPRGHTQRPGVESVPSAPPHPRGDPNNATLFINLELFREAFVFSRMGYGAAMAWLLFAIVLVLTIALFAVSRRRVYHAGGER